VVLRFKEKEMVVMEGSLSKWTNVMKGWQYRWFVLDDNSGLLTYYTVSTPQPVIFSRKHNHEKRLAFTVIVCKQARWV
jgi:hypothetical protein